jgi:DNA polymerase-3 subunit delta'
MSAPFPWQVEQWQTVCRARAAGRLHHALLLAGPPGVGKAAFIEAFTGWLLCERPGSDTACGECRGCRQHAAGSHPDCTVLSPDHEQRAALARYPGQRCQYDSKRKNPSTVISVEQVRELHERLHASSHYGGHKVAVLLPAEALNTAAANALLKTLEEPVPQTLLLLVADAPWRLPATIRSRCQRIELALPPSAQASDWLHAQGVAQADEALAAAAGNPGLALAWAGQGALARRTEVRKDLAALAAGRGVPLEVARRWQSDEPAQRLWFAAQAAVDEVRARAAADAPPLSSRQDAETLHAWFAAANRARDALRGPLRGDLVLFELLTRWR